MSEIKTIGVLTSGGDAPGMNAAIRAVVRKAIYHNIDVLGIKRGYSGLINGEIEPLPINSVGDVIHRGGTFLHTARSEEFRTSEGRSKAWDNILSYGIEGLIVIGGNGSFCGAQVLAREYPVKIIGVPATIDNDIPGTDYSIGFDTSVNNVVDAVNKIRDTATAIERIVVIEVMGRHAGFIALEAGLASGAESILIPEEPLKIEEICHKIRRGFERGKLHSIILVAEGAASGMEVGRQITEKIGLDTRVTILGHIQRGGNPTAYDRNQASRMGAKAVDLLLAGVANHMIAIKAGKVISINFDEALNKSKIVDLEMYSLANILSI